MKSPHRRQEPDSLIAEPDAPGRRRFLGGLLGAGALGVVPLAPLAADALAQSRPRVLVLGAGLAGLHAATLLESRGFPVTVIEARDRVGGRLKTLDHVSGRPEGGGNVIGPNYGRVISTARRLGVALQAPGRGEGMGLVLAGERIDRDGWPDSPRNTLPDPLKAVTPDRIGSFLLRDNPLTTASSWRSPALVDFDRAADEFYRSRGLDDTAIGWVDANNSYGNRLADTSLLSLYRVSASIGRAIAMKQPVFEVQGGNQRLPEAMAAALETEVVTGEPVAAVKRGAGGDYRVETRGGRAFEGAAVVCTLPLPALRAVAFEPGWPEAQAEAIREVDYHQVTQAHFVASEPYWESAGEPAGWWTDGPLGRVFTRQAPDGTWNITCWINGDDCQRYDGQPLALAKERLEEDFAALVPASRGKVELGEMVSWARTPWNRGSWAIWAPGQIGRHADALGQPLGRVFFAGEHTAFANSGMEGAMESGERAALEVMRALA